MFLILTRAFPPELGGMQSLMWGQPKRCLETSWLKFLQIIKKIIKNLIKMKIFLLKGLVVLNF